MYSYLYLYCNVTFGQVGRFVKVFHKLLLHLNAFTFLFSASPIVEYIDAQFEKYLQQELKIRRSLNAYNDTRVHVCLYFISPSGHS